MEKEKGVKAQVRDAFETIIIGDKKQTQNGDSPDSTALPVKLGLSPQTKDTKKGGKG